MRKLPPDVAALVQPLPDDFKIGTLTEGRTILWRGAVPMADGSRTPCELGFQTDLPDALQILKASVWQLMELGRLGRADLLAYAHQERHQGRTPLSPMPMPTDGQEA